MSDPNHHNHDDTTQSPDEHHHHQHEQEQEHCGDSQTLSNSSSASKACCNKPPSVSIAALVASSTLSSSETTTSTSTTTTTHMSSNPASRVVSPRASTSAPVMLLAMKVDSPITTTSHLVSSNSAPANIGKFSPHDSVPDFISEGFVDDIWSIQRQTQRQGMGEKTSYLFSDQVQPYSGQFVFLEVCYKAAMLEMNSSFLKTVVSRMEGTIVRVQPEIVALCSVVDKMVKEMVGDWEVTLRRDSSFSKNRWRVSGMIPKDSATPTSARSSIETSSSTSSLNPTTTMTRLPTSSSFTFTSMLTTTDISSNPPTRPRKRRRAKAPEKVVLTEDALERLNEFKLRHKNDSAIANWDLHQYIDSPTCQLPKRSASDPVLSKSSKK